MLNIALKEIWSALHAPGLWLIFILFNMLDLFFALLKFNMFNVCGDIFLIAVQIIVYFIVKVRK